MHDDEIAFKALMGLSDCKYVYDSILDGAILTVFHHHNLGKCPPDRFENIKRMVVKGLKQIFPLNGEGKPHDETESSVD